MKHDMESHFCNVKTDLFQPPETCFQKSTYISNPTYHMLVILQFKHRYFKAADHYSKLRNRYFRTCISEKQYIST